MDIIRKITELSFQLDFVKEFSEFVDIVHTEFKCSNSEFTLGIFNNKLKIATDKNISGGKSTYLFMEICFRFVDVFSSMYSYLNKVMGT